MNTDSGNYAKYQTLNPVAKYLIDRFLVKVVRHVKLSGARRVLDVGCGEGLVAAALRNAGLELEYQGFDLRPEAVAAARQLNPGWSFEVADLHALPVVPGWADLVICLEVLEHLKHPAAAVACLSAMTSRQALISVPWEPWFRWGNLLRGKYMHTWGNHPEHIQQFNPLSLRILLRRNFAQTELVSSVFPWILAQSNGPKQSGEA